MEEHKKPFVVGSGQAARAHSTAPPMSVSSALDPDATQPPGVSPSVAAAAAEAREWPSLPGYEILGVLGQGGMGVVYKARQISLSRVVALKMILHAEHAGAEQLRRFRAEAEAVARLQHPHIVQIYEIGEHKGLPYFSLEYCAGGSLADKLAGAPLPPTEAAQLVQTLAVAMQAAHQADIIHRDLKPANVLLTAERTPKITDFGLARKLDEVGQTASGAVMGTPSYMAPEQAQGNKHEVGPATDVYALGAILYECLTGRPPFQATTALDTILQVIAEDPISPRQFADEIPRDLEMICLKCLEKAAQRRYPSTAELAADLQRFQEGEPVSVRQSGLVDRLVSSLDRVRLQAHFSQYARLMFYLAPLMLLTDSWITLVVQQGWSHLLLPLGQFSRAAGFLFLLGHARRWRWTPQGPIERHLWVVWGGYLLACMAVGFSNGVAFGLQDPLLELRNYPTWAALTALAYFSLAANFWGFCAVIGLLFLGLMFVMAVDLRWAALEFGVTYAVLLVFYGLRFRRLEQAAASPDGL